MPRVPLGSSFAADCCPSARLICAHADALHSMCILTLCRRGQPTDTLPDSIKTLLHHLDKLSEERKVMLAMTAMLTR